MINNVEKTFRELWNAFRPIRDIHAQLFSPRFQKSLEAIQKRAAELPDEVRILSYTMAQQGWYMGVNMDLKFVNVLIGCQVAGKLQDIDALMMSYTNRHLSEDEENIVAGFPKRAHILKEAFEAHRSKKYVLSVPTFLTQADGICSELLGTKFYSLRKGTPLTAKVVGEHTPNDFMSSLLEPLRLAGALSASEHERAKYPDVLNRHEVLHGISLDYGSEISSLRAISLLSYLSTTVVMALDFNRVSLKPSEKATVSEG